MHNLGLISSFMAGVILKQIVADSLLEMVILYLIKQLF